LEDKIAVVFEAQVRQVKTMADHSVNVTLNIPEYCNPQAAWFLNKIDELVKVLVEMEHANHIDGLELANGTKRRGRKSQAG
jgi:hypothetical protein